MVELKEKHCVPCEGDTKPFNTDEINEFKKNVNSNWKVIDYKKIKREFPFENFKRGMDFAQEVATLANEEDHHPDLCIHYSSVEIELTTHAIGGLSENDFIMAAKIDGL
ncbi:4a-hydroxytetrahydrobiopterin dehydratase [Draconibacterium sp.]|jgi:4a-hydroxytetrahydrobiopterin dehydratase